MKKEKKMIRFFCFVFVFFFEKKKMVSLLINFPPSRYSPYTVALLFVVTNNFLLLRNKAKNSSKLHANACKNTCYVTSSIMLSNVL